MQHTYRPWPRVRVRVDATGPAMDLWPVGRTADGRELVVNARGEVRVGVRVTSHARKG